MSNVTRIPLPDKLTSDTSPEQALHEALRRAQEADPPLTGVFIFHVAEYQEGSSEDTATYSAGWIRGGKSLSNHVRTIGWLEYVKSELLHDLLEPVE